MRLHLLLSLALISSCFAANAQKVKPLFNSITDVVYNTNSKNQAVIKDIVEVNSRGIVHYRSIWYNGIADTTYALPDTTIAKLNKFFNGAKLLTRYILTDKMEPGHHFAGPLEYVAYVDKNNKPDDFILVGPFIAPAFDNVLREINVMPSRVSYKGNAITILPLSRQIKITEARCSYIPKIEEPPEVMELKN